jgi:hypothetical protein
MAVERVNDVRQADQVIAGGSSPYTSALRRRARSERLGQMYC